MNLFDLGLNLIRHIDVKHQNLRYRCNQCFYRGISIEHVNLHQIVRHESFMKRGQCQVILCQVPSGSNLDLQYFYSNCGISFVKNFSTKFQCFFCFHKSHSLHKLVYHQVEKHPDFPLLYYLPYESQKTLNNGHCTTSSTDVIPKFNTSEKSEFLSESHKICFFCDFQSTSAKVIKYHLSAHLFGPKKVKYDPFFDNWMDNFIEMQGSYILENDQFSKLCSICTNLKRFSHAALESRNESPEVSDNVPEANYNVPEAKDNVPELHFIVHSCFKPIKCLLCDQENVGHFYMPNRKMRIIDHLVYFHRKQIQNYPDVRNSGLFNFTMARECTQQEWDHFKELLIEESIIFEYTEESVTSLATTDQKALVMLKSRYVDLLNLFHCAADHEALDV